MAEEKEVALPEGFEIDSTESDDSSLPEGFAVDTSEQDSKQEVLDSTASKGRQMIGKAFMSITQPTRIGEQVAQGRLFKDDPFEQTVGNILDSAAQTASYGIPKAITKKIIEATGLKYPEIEDKKAKAVGEFIGLISPTKTAIGVANSIKGLVGRTIVKDIARGAAAGGMVGFSTSPDEFTDIGQRIKQAQFGAAVGAVAVPVERGLANLGKVAFKSKEFAQKVRNSLFESKKEIGNQFETQLNTLIENNPAKVVDLEQPFQRLKTLSESNSRLVGDLKAGAKRAGFDQELLDGFIKDPASAKRMTLNQTRELKKIVSEVPSIKANLRKGKFASYSDTDIDLIDFADEIKGQQLGAFQELGEINKAYSQKMTNYNLIKDKFRVGKLLDNVQKNFGDAEVRDIVKQLLPKDVIQEIGGYRASLKFLNAMKWIGIVGAGTTVAGGIGRKVFSGGGSGIGYQEGGR